MRLSLDLFDEIRGAIMNLRWPSVSLAILAAMVMQTTAALGQATATTAQPAPAVASPAPAPPIDPMTRMQLPLHPWEKVVPFADGRCGLIGDEFSTPIEGIWQGSCRFGLAHGIGMFQGQSGGRSLHELRYGSSTNLPRYIPEMKHTYIDSLSSAPNYRRVGVYTGEGLDLAIFNSKLGSVIFDRFSTTSAVRLWFTTSKFSCPFTKFDVEFEPSRDNLRAISRICSLATSPEEGGLAVLRSVSTFDRVRGKDVLKDAGRFEGWICRKDSKAAKPDCSEAIQTAIGPYLNEINEVILADKDAKVRAIAEISKRFEPLEAAARPRRLAIAREIASTYAPSRAPTLAPAVQRPGAAGARQPGRNGKSS
jgi:hypothetical protein